MEIRLLSDQQRGSPCYLLANVPTKPGTKEKWTQRQATGATELDIHCPTGQCLFELIMSSFSLQRSHLP
jgi:hypothetical protein